MSKPFKEKDTLGDVKSDNMPTHVITEQGQPQVIIVECGSIELDKNDLERIKGIVLTRGKTWEIWMLSQSDIDDMIGEIAESRRKAEGRPDLIPWWRPGGYADIWYDKVAKAFKKKVEAFLAESAMDWKEMLKEAMRDVSKEVTVT